MIFSRCAHPVWRGVWRQREGRCISGVCVWGCTSAKDRRESPEGRCTLQAQGGKMKGTPVDRGLKTRQREGWSCSPAEAVMGGILKTRNLPDAGGGFVELKIPEGNPRRDADRGAEAAVGVGSRGAAEARRPRRPAALTHQVAFWMMGSPALPSRCCCLSPCSLPFLHRSVIFQFFPFPPAFSISIHLLRCGWRDGCHFKLRISLHCLQNGFTSVAGRFIISDIPLRISYSVCL